MLVRASLLATALLPLACSLAEASKDACETDRHCLSGRLCVAGVCRPRAESVPPTFTLFDAEFLDLDHTSDYPGGLESPRQNRIELFVIEPVTGGLLNRGWADDFLDGGWYRDFIRLPPLKDGADATSWGDLHQDIIVRNQDDTVMHVFTQTKPFGWGWQPVGTRTGRFRPTVTHLGRNRLVAFQVDAETGEVWVSRFEAERWSEWSAGTPGKLSGGLDAATLHEGAPLPGQEPLVIGAQIVSRNQAGNLVTTTYDPVTHAMEPWQALSVEPRGGSEGQATVVTHFGPDYHIFVSAKMGGVWGLSARQGPEASSRSFVQLGNGGGSGGDLDAVSWPFESRWRLVMVRRDPTSGRIQLGHMDSDLTPGPEISTRSALSQ